MVEYSHILRSEDETAAMGARLAPVLREGDIVCLEGPLGAGKTTLARGLIGAFCGEANAPSPTFTLAETYQTKDATLWHFDLYRLEKPEDVWELGLEDALDTGISLIEWPDRIARILPADILRLIIYITADRERSLQIMAPDRWIPALRNAGIA
jgi:tRNA threonylcarbamoyladenosine biosynthesis protein TsaE